MTLSAPHKEMRKDYVLEKRKFVIGGFITLIVAIYLIRLFNLQVETTNTRSTPTATLSSRG